MSSFILVDFFSWDRTKEFFSWMSATISGIGFGLLFFLVFLKMLWRGILIIIIIY